MPESQPPHDRTRIAIGAAVVLREKDAAKTLHYRIVPAEQADAGCGRLSIQSPVARAMLGAEAGDTVEVSVPSGIRHYSIESVSYE